MQVGPFSLCCWGRPCLLVLEPGLDRLAGVAAVAAEFEVGEAARSCCFPYPGFGQGEDVGYLGGAEEAIAGPAWRVVWQRAFLPAGGAGTPVAVDYRPLGAKLLSTRSGKRVLLGALAFVWSRERRLSLPGCRLGGAH